MAGGEKTKEKRTEHSKQQSQTKSARYSEITAGAVGTASAAEKIHLLIRSRKCKNDAI
jgi:hypothetical protein